MQEFSTHENSWEVENAKEFKREHNESEHHEPSEKSLLSEGTMEEIGELASIIAKGTGIPFLIFIFGSKGNLRFIELLKDKVQKNSLLSFEKFISNPKKYIVEIPELIKAAFVHAVESESAFVVNHIIRIAEKFFISIPINNEEILKLLKRILISEQLQVQSKQVQILKLILNKKDSFILRQEELENSEFKSLVSKEVTKKVKKSLKKNSLLDLDAEELQDNLTEKVLDDDSKEEEDKDTKTGRQDNENFKSVQFESTVDIKPLTLNYEFLSKSSAIEIAFR